MENQEAGLQHTTAFLLASRSEAGKVATQLVDMRIAFSFRFEEGTLGSYWQYRFEVDSADFAGINTWMFNKHITGRYTR